MNQQLTAIKARALAATTDIGTALEKAKAAAEFRHHAAADVLALVAEVERLRQEIDEAEKLKLDYCVNREELRDEVERLRGNQEQLAGATKAALEFFRIEGQYGPEQRGLAKMNVEGKLLAALQEKER